MNHNLNIVVQKSLLTMNLADPAPMHDFYRDYFNLIDRCWYAVEEHHHHHQNWKTKVILAILRNATINAWVYTTKSDYLEWPSTGAKTSSMSGWVLHEVSYQNTFFSEFYLFLYKCMIISSSLRH